MPDGAVLAVALNAPNVSVVPVRVMFCVRLLAVATAASVLPLTVRSLVVVAPAVSLMLVSLTVAVILAFVASPVTPRFCCIAPRVAWVELVVKSVVLTAVEAVLPVADARLTEPEMVKGEPEVVPIDIVTSVPSAPTPVCAVAEDRLSCSTEIPEVLTVVAAPVSLSDCDAVLLIAVAAVVLSVIDTLLFVTSTPLPDVLLASFAVAVVPEAADTD